MGKYFQVEVKPIINASIQKLGAFADGDVLFDWTAFDLPKGANRLIDARAISRGADGVANSFAMAIHFAKTLNKTQPATIGTSHAAPQVGEYYNHSIGHLSSEELDTLTGAGGSIAGLNHHLFLNNRQAPHEFVLQGEPDSGENVGFDKFYIAGVNIDGDPTFASTVQVGTSDTSTSSPIITVKTTQATKLFAVGDIVHDEDNQLMGTIKSVDSTTQITLEENCANVSAVNKDLYVLNPIKFILSFER